MSITRRDFTLGAAAVGASALGIARPATAQVEPIRVGWLAALTGPSSAPTLGFNRGVMFAAESINAAGGVKGRKLEIITRDTQGDPSKAVNAAQEMISQIKTHAIWGPTLSGESLAVTPVLARAKMPNLHACVVDSLIDPVKFPNAFRISTSGPQWDDAVSFYVLQKLKAKKIAIIADTGGYGVAALKSSVETFKRDMKDGAELVYQSNIDATQTDVTPDLLRARNAGADVMVLWTPAGGLAARIMNARAALGWDVPIVGHAQMAAGDVGKLLDKKSNWEKVYSLNYRSCCLDQAGKLPPRTQELLGRLKGKVELGDTSLFLVACAVDAINLIAKAVEMTGSTVSEDFIKYWNTVDKYPGYFGEYTFTPSRHNGFPTKDVVLAAANSNKDGSLTLAPGYT